MGLLKCSIPYTEFTLCHINRKCQNITWFRGNFFFLSTLTSKSRKRQFFWILTLFYQVRGINSTAILFLIWLDDIVNFSSTHKGQCRIQRFFFCLQRWNYFNSEFQLIWHSVNWRARVGIWEMWVQSFWFDQKMKKPHF